MSTYERLRRNGVSEQRLAALGIQPSEPKPLPNDLAAASADLEAWRTYRAASVMARIQLYSRNGAAIERGRELDMNLPPKENQ